MGRNKNQNRKANHHGATTAPAAAPPTPASAKPPAPAVTASTPVMTAPVVQSTMSGATAAAPLDASADKGYIRATMESETVEKTVSYLAGYAPALVNFYGQVKEQLPGTIKGHVDALETDYVVPYTKQGLVVANDTVTKVDDFVLKTEARVRTSVTSTTEAVLANVETTKNTVREAVAPYQTAVETTKDTVIAAVAPYQAQALAKKDELVAVARPYVDKAVETTTGLVYTTVGTGLDQIELAVDYVLPANDEDAALAVAEAVNPAEDEAALLQERVGKLSAKLVSRLEQLSLVAAIHKSKADAIQYVQKTRESTNEFVTKTRSSTTEYVSNKYAGVDQAYLQPSREYVLAKYAKSLEAKNGAMETLNTMVIEPTTAFVKGFKKESWSNDMIVGVKENLPKSREELRLKLVEGYNMLQKNVLLPAAKYAGVAETFKAYEEFIISKVFVSVQASALDNNGAVELVDQEDDGSPEVWHDAPTKMEFEQKMVPLYPTDESP